MGKIGKPQKAVVKPKPQPVPPPAQQAGALAPERPMGDVPTPMAPAVAGGASPSSLQGSGGQGTNTTPQAGQVPAYRVQSVPEHFHRAGRRWTREHQVVPTAELTTEQEDALLGEPNLVVELIFIEEA